MGLAGQSCTADEGALKQPWQGGDGVWIRVAPQREVRLELHGYSESGKSRKSGRGVGMSFPFFLLSLLVLQSQKPGAGGLPREC